MKKNGCKVLFSIEDKYDRRGTKKAEVPQDIISIEKAEDTKDILLKTLLSQYSAEELLQMLLKKAI